MQEKEQPPLEVFDDNVGKELLGRTLLIGITHEDHQGNFLRRSQIFGRVDIAERGRGIRIHNEADGSYKWFPPDTRGIKKAPPGTYRNRATGEVVNDPDYTASWVFTEPQPQN